MGPQDGARIRLDKWLFHARLCKSRALACSVIAAGQVRLNGRPVDKPAVAVGAGDVLTLRLMQGVRVLRIVDSGHRRGPAVEARSLYEEIPPATGS